MEKTGGHMLRYSLTFSCIIYFSANIIAQENQIESDTLQAKLNRDVQVNYPGKPLLMSLLLPGYGQYYNGSSKWKVLGFAAVELGSILAHSHFQREGNKIKRQYQEFADMNWELENWVFNRFDNPPNTLDGLRWDNFEALTKFAGTHDIRLIVSDDLANDINRYTVSSASLDTFPEWFYNGDVKVVRDRHFYENIGKYNQFLGGWNDARDNWYVEEKDVGDSTEYIIITPMKDDYRNQRYSSNRKLSIATYTITVLMFNHVFSGIEAVWTNQNKRKNQKINKVYKRTKFGLVYSPHNKHGIGGIRMEINI